MIYTELTKKAIKLCFEAHKDQFDKSGLPYVTHPLHLAEQMSDETTTVVALLHDVVEDSSFTMDDITAAGFPKEVTDALVLLTHEDTVPYLEYVASLKHNPVARCVKLADLQHNSDLSRIDSPTEKDMARVQKYRKAINLLEKENESAVSGEGQEDMLSDEWAHLGSSCADNNAITLVGMQSGTIVPQMLWFDLPGEYYATVIHDGKPVPDGFTEMARYEGFVDAITVNGHGAFLRGEEIAFYRRGEAECVVIVK